MTEMPGTAVLTAVMKLVVPMAFVMSVVDVCALEGTVIVIVLVAVLTVTTTSSALTPGIWLATAAAMSSTDCATVSSDPSGKLRVKVTTVAVPVGVGGGGGPTTTIVGLTFVSVVTVVEGTAPSTALVNATDRKSVV